MQLRNKNTHPKPTPTATATALAGGWRRWRWRRCAAFVFVRISIWIKSIPRPAGRALEALAATSLGAIPCEVFRADPDTTGPVAECSAALVHMTIGGARPGPCMAMVASRTSRSSPEATSAFSPLGPRTFHCFLSALANIVACGRTAAAGFARICQIATQLSMSGVVPDVVCSNLRNPSAQVRDDEGALLSIEAHSSSSKGRCGIIGGVVLGDDVSGRPGPCVFVGCLGSLP